MYIVKLPEPRWCSEYTLRFGCKEYINHDMEPFEEGCLIDQSLGRSEGGRNKIDP